MLTPKNFYKMMWDLQIGFVYLACYLLDPLVFAFAFEPLLVPSINIWQRILTALLLIDAALVPFSATYKKEATESEDHPSKAV